MASSLNSSNVVRFEIVGGTTAGLFYGLVFLFYELVGLAVIWASLLSSIIAISFNYQAHYRWTFTSDAPHRRALGRFLVMTTASVAINSALMVWLVDYLAWNLFLAQTLAAAAMLTWNFLLSRFWVYR